MISLQRSMHSSQMYTPGPAMSFLTCFWLFPQNEHLSKSPPSPMRATQQLLYPGAASGGPATSRRVLPSRQALLHRPTSVHERYRPEPSMRSHHNQRGGSSPT